ncbi:hypothetical protein HN011_000990 [Eciton burchellii]|nr:hypothetical protein HN011_000990 [Eciton burchellii]
MCCERQHAFREVDNDLRIVLPILLKPRVIRQGHEREEHFSVVGIGVLLDEGCRNSSIRDEIQKESRRGFSRKRKKKKALTYCENDLAAIKDTQQGPELKLANKYLGPYKIIKVLRNNQYVVRKMGDHEGP